MFNNCLMTVLRFLDDCLMTLSDGWWLLDESMTANSLQSWNWPNYNKLSNDHKTKYELILPWFHFGIGPKPAGFSVKTAHLFSVSCWNSNPTKLNCSKIPIQSLFLWNYYLKTILSRKSNLANCLFSIFV